MSFSRRDALTDMQHELSGSPRDLTDLDLRQFRAVPTLCRVVGSSPTATWSRGPPHPTDGVSVTVYCIGLVYDVSMDEIYGGYGRKMILVYRLDPKTQIIN